MLLAHPRQDFPAGQATTVLRTPAHVGVEETRVSLRLAARRPRCGTATYEALFAIWADGFQGKWSLSGPFAFSLSRTVGRCGISRGSRSSGRVCRDHSRRNRAPGRPARSGWSASC